MNKRLRIADIAKATGLSKTTIIRYEEDGTLPSSKRDGRKWRYYLEEDKTQIIQTLKDLNLI